MRTSLSTIIDESGEAPDNLDSHFVPVFIESSVKGAIGVTARESAMSSDALDILRLVATRASHVFTNATLHRDTKLLAYTDGLTGLLNHRAFKDRFDREFERFTRYGSYLSIILADFDNLKVFNDTFGHPVGDEILRKIGDILRETSRDSDVLARYGVTNLSSFCHRLMRTMHAIWPNVSGRKSNHIHSSVTVRRPM